MGLIKDYLVLTKTRNKSSNKQIESLQLATLKGLFKYG